MTTREAYLELVNSPYLWQSTGRSKSSRRLDKHRIEKGHWPTTQKMEQVLKDSGRFQVIQEIKWGTTH